MINYGLPKWGLVLRFFFILKWWGPNCRMRRRRFPLLNMNGHWGSYCKFILIFFSRKAWAKFCGFRDLVCKSSQFPWVFELWIIFFTNFYFFLRKSGKICRFPWFWCKCAALEKYLSEKIVFILKIILFS